MTDHGPPVGPSDPPPPADPSSDAGAEDAAPDGAPDLTEQLAAEQAGVAYWRAVAAARRTEAARVQHRPLVRAAVAVDRRTAALQGAMSARVRAAGAAAGQAAVVAAGLARRPGRRSRHAELEAQIARTSATVPTDSRPVLVVHLGPAPVPLAPDQVHLVRPSVPEPSESPGGTELADAVNALVQASSAPLVCLVGPATDAREPGWLRRLAALVDGDVVATAPLVLHPERPLREATAHDLRVRALGLGVSVVDDAPTAVALHAGEAPDLAAPGEDLAGATAAAIVVDRRAWVDAGGLGTSADLDAAVFDLCARLRAAGGTIRSVPSSVVVDHRPVRSAVELSGPFPPEGEAWRQVVDAHGPALVRRAAPAAQGWTVALTTATPSRKIASVSGDWHYAGLFAAALGRAGHRVRCSTIDEADGLAERACDLRVVLRGLEPVRRTPGQRHVIWVISHPEALEVSECDEADLVVVASHRYAAHLRTLTSTPVEVLLQATDPGHFRPVTPARAHRHRITVVANTRGFSRAAVADALAAGLDPAVYGTGWDDLVPPGTVRSSYVPFEELPAVYASADVVLNDHWETMRRWGFLSNRLFDVAACGTPVVSDDLPEVQEVFGPLVPTWRTPAELREVVVGLLADPRGTAARVEQARQLVLGAHTMDHRVAELTELLARHHLTPGAGPRR